MRYADTSCEMRNTPPPSSFNINVSVETGFQHPAMIANRVNFDWTPRRFYEIGDIGLQWSLRLARYIDWACFIPEINDLSASDKVTFFVAILAKPKQNTHPKKDQKALK